MNFINKIFFIILIYEFTFIYYLHAASSTPNSIKPTNIKRPIGICKANQTTLTPFTTWEIINEPQLQNYSCHDGSGNICTRHVMVPRNVTRTISIKGFKVVNVCCKGYRKMGKTCEPRCHPECEHGQCIKPNTCKCDRGYKALTNSKCTPDCQNCKNGYCLTPTDCKCYSLYEKADNGTCVPRCDPKCINGDCLKADGCTCHAGYEADPVNNHICNPICKLPCGDGGRCVAPDTCECNSAGYRINATNQCEPICENCENGVCVKPDDCVCNQNYESKMEIIGRNIKMRCEPVCREPCGERGRCLEPDVCECDLGYRINATQKCEPICSNCEHGTCIVPGECVCNDKYERTEIMVGMRKEATCEPICQAPCGEGGHCISPDVCDCSAEYRLNATNQCEPVCFNCDFGTCIKGECVCDDKYERKINHKSEMLCSPICRLACGDGGDCIEPDVCYCSTGYRLNATQQCEPICNSCNNGVCIKPDECVCNEKFKRKMISNGQNTEMICEPICQVPCGDRGPCIMPDVCECDVNYRFNATGQCDPICENCANGQCYVPNECVCNDKYERQEVLIDYEVEMSCMPICRRECGDGGQCVAPDVCECSSGYQLNDTHQCEPICTDPCLNGFCSGVNECTCNKGFAPDINLKHVCNRICDPPCINGRCTADNECECLPGYLQHAFTYHVCVDCNYTCLEGEACPLPEGCPCPDSEERNTETNTCEKAPTTEARVCKDECINSNCTYGQCICYNGYNKKDAVSSICYPLCNNKFNGCIQGKCSAPDICVCKDDYILSPYSKFECILVERTTSPTTKLTTSPTTTPEPRTTPSFSQSTSLSPSTTEFIQKSDKILEEPLHGVNEAECFQGDCSKEKENMKENDFPRLLKAHYNYILIVIGVTVLCVLIILTMIYRKYNRTKTFKTHEQEAFLSSPYFIGGPIKTSCDIELEES